MMYWNDGFGAWHWASAALVMTVFWGTLIAAILLALRHATRVGDGSPNGTPTAEDLLAQRFARGEIDEEEFRRRLSTLRESQRT